MTIFEGGFADDPRLADLFAEGGPFEITETIAPVLIAMPRASLVAQRTSWRTPRWLLAITPTT